MGKPAFNKRNLTEGFVARARPMTKPYLIWDAGCRGLVLSIQPTGSRSSKFFYSRNRRSRWYHIGPADIGLSAARKLATKLMVQVAEGADPQAAKLAQRSTGTFGDLYDGPYATYAKAKNRSWAAGKALVDRHLKPKWAKLPAADIKRADVRRIVADIAEASPSTANVVLAMASAFFAWAIREEAGGVTVNPCHGVERFKLTSRGRVLSASELPQFWSAFDAVGPIRAAALRILLLTGQRPGEVLHMRREHIQGGWWELPGAPDAASGWPGTKSGKGHRVWLSEPVHAILATLDHDEPFLFPGDRGKPVRGALVDAMADICRQLVATSKATPHDLRRSFATTVASMGFGPQAVDRLLNHADGGIGAVYDRHGYQAEDKRIWEAVGAHIMSLANGEVPASNVTAFKQSAKVD